VVLVLVNPLHLHSLLTPPLEAKLIYVAISPTIATMKPYGLRMGLFILFLSTRLLNWFILTRFLTLFPKEHIPESALELDRLLEIICGSREYGRVSSLFLFGVGLAT
jgi:hypothetical protein